MMSDFDDPDTAGLHTGSDDDGVLDAEFDVDDPNAVLGASRRLACSLLREEDDHGRF